MHSELGKLSPIATGPEKWTDGHGWQDLLRARVRRMDETPGGKTEKPGSYELSQQSTAQVLKMTLAAMPRL